MTTSQTQREASVAAGLGIVLALVAANLSSNLLADSLLQATVSVAPLFLIWFNVSFDVFGFAIAAGMDRWSVGGPGPGAPAVLSEAAAAVKEEAEELGVGGNVDADINGEVEDRLLHSASSTSDATLTGGRLSGRLSTRRIRGVALILCMIYQSGNFLYFVGLASTPLGVSQVVYQSATVFVFIFSALLLRGFITNPVKILSLILCIIGVSLVSTAGVGASGTSDGTGSGTGTIATNTSNPSPSTSTPAVASTLFGILCLLLSSSLWALYEVLIPLLLPGACPADLNRFIAWRGVWNFVLLWPLPLIQSTLSPIDYVFLESSIFFSMPIFLKLIGMALLSVCSSLLIAIGITVTSPLYMRIGATLNAPVSVLWDAVVRGNAQGWQSLSGLFLTVGSFVLVLLPCSESVSGETAVSSWFHVSTGPCWGSRCRRLSDRL